MNCIYKTVSKFYSIIYPIESLVIFRPNTVSTKNPMHAQVYNV